jgi:hypothetical protein
MLIQAAFPCLGQLKKNSSKAVGGAAFEDFLG